MVECVQNMLIRASDLGVTANSHFANLWPFEFQQIILRNINILNP